MSSIVLYPLSQFKLVFIYSFHVFPLRSPNHQAEHPILIACMLIYFRVFTIFCSLRIISNLLFEDVWMLLGSLIKLCKETAEPHTVAFEKVDLVIFICLLHSISIILIKFSVFKFYCFNIGPLAPLIIHPGAQPPSLER